MQGVERKVLSILKILSNSQKTIGARVISRRLNGLGIELGERAVRYHLKLMDEQGLTQCVGRDGRVITELGVEELKSALVRDKIDFVASRIDQLAYNTDFDLDKRAGSIPINVCLLPKEKFKKTLKIMEPVFKAGLCISDLVAIAYEGETISELVVPEGRLALATVCTVTMNGIFIKAGIPMLSRFCGILQLKNHHPLRFLELIHYAGCSLNPTELFIRAKMTSVTQAARSGNGKILSIFREIPAVSRPTAQELIARLKEARLGGILLMGSASESVCEIPVDFNQVGMIICAGLNPAAAAAEAGIEIENYAMSGMTEYQKLIKFSDLR